MGLLTRVLPLALALAACNDPVRVELSRIDGPRVLAVASTPAEAAPGAAVTLHALWVDPDGERDPGALRWFSCVERRALAEVGPIAQACIDREPDARVSVGTGDAVAATLPASGCRLFGPDPPPAQPGEPQARAVDPDLTGGYYQPLLLEADEQLAGFGVRLDCGTAGSTPAQAAELRRRHRDNVAPVVEALARTDGSDDAPVLSPDEPLRVHPGDRVELRVRWASCAAQPRCGDGACTLDEDASACPGDCPTGAGCEGAEWYARFDPVALAIDERREAISVAWYATDGTFDAARTGRADDDLEPSSSNAWTAPTEPSDVLLWVVLRDDRGGVSWRRQLVEVDGGR